MLLPNIARPLSNGTAATLPSTSVKRRLVTFAGRPSQRAKNIPAGHGSRYPRRSGFREQPRDKRKAAQYSLGGWLHSLRTLLGHKQIKASWLPWMRRSPARAFRRRGVRSPLWAPHERPAWSR